MASFEGLSGETCTKNPGELSGAPFTVNGLDGCTVQLLDYTASVTVSECTNCKILIGPTASAAFETCTGCTVMVACGEFKATGCSDMSFGLFSATAPTVEGCSNLTFAAWNAAYPGLDAQFQAAGLPADSNLWNQITDLSEGEGLQSFQLNEFAPADLWEVQIEGMENPLGDAVAAPAADNFFGAAPAEGDFFGAAAIPAADSDPFGAPPADAPLGGGFGAPLGDDFGAPAAAMPLGDDFAAPAAMPLGDDFAVEPTPAAVQQDNPKVTAMREAMRVRMKEVDTRESETKSKLVSTAHEYLDTLYKNREDATTRRKKNNREEEALSGGQEARGDTYWERIVEYIDFAMDTNKGVDMTRYKNVLFAAKAKNVPVHCA